MTVITRFFHTTTVASIIFVSYTMNSLMNFTNYSKTCENGHSKIDKTKILMTNDSLMKVKSIAKCSPWRFLQYFLLALKRLGL